MPFTQSSRLALFHIDDDPDDRFLLQTAIHSASSQFDIHEFDNIHAAIATLRSKSSTLLSSRLVLLDYDLGSERRGTDFLYWLRTQQGNTAIPVIMYTGSSDEATVAECYRLGANHYITKSHCYTRTMALAYTLLICFSRPTPRFHFLDRLPESLPDLRTLAIATSC